MPVIRNKSVLGELDIPLLRRFVEFGQEIEVSAEHALELLKQAVNWDAVDAEAKNIASEIAGALKTVEDASVTPDMLPAPTPADVPPVPEDVVEVKPASKSKAVEKPSDDTDKAASA